MGNKTAAIVAVCISGLIAACGASPSPADLRTQATIAAVQGSGMVAQANEIERRQIEARQTAVSLQATLSAPTPTPLPPPTMTPLPTVAPTATPEPTATTAPSATPMPTVELTVEPTATPAPAAPRGRTIYDDWPLIVLLGLGALGMVVALWRLIDGKTVTLPGRGDR
jgi:hypothetical protein